eukprot:422959-Rhodomonas_salina.1
MKQREVWKARAPVLAHSAACSPSCTAFLTVQILQTQNSVLSVEVKAKTGAKVKDSVKKTEHEAEGGVEVEAKATTGAKVKASAKKTEHEAKGGMESKGTCASSLHSSLSFLLSFPHSATPGNPEQSWCIVSGSKGKS